ncbi:hypothetical protein [Hydrogenophaga sp.]|uniref:hypothetical protein n=1 Tax=Hydrogenophaga sp. TaxID=1904254 RepID=UPI0025B8D2D2|nr:hypothetical protein [Hydrogenophaga sp.]
MLSLTRSFLPALALGFCLSAGAQAPVANPPESAPLPPGQRVQSITHEDQLTRIDELRVGGQTQRIEVQPKNGAPAYDIAPLRSELPGQGASERTGNSGKSSWRLLDF